MRSVLILPLALGAAGVAQAQIQPPKNPYAISPPTIGSTQSNGSSRSYEPPKLP